MFLSLLLLMALGIQHRLLAGSEGREHHTFPLYLEIQNQNDTSMKF